MSTALAPNTIEIPEEVRAKLKARAGGVGMLPAVAMQALELAKRPDCSITEFSRVVERDVKLAADILSMANSSLFAGSSPLSSLHQSIVRLGLHQCKNLIYCSSLTALMKKLSDEDAVTRERLWRHSFHTALLALHFNHSCSIGYQGEEFTAGLLHDIGRMLIGVCLPDRAAELDLMDFDDSPRLLDHEQQLCGVDHCELGAWFAKENGLPSPLADAVRFHHQPTRASRNHRLIALTAACDHMANHLQRHGDPEGYDPAENQALEVLEAAGVRDAARQFTAMHEVLMRNALHDATQMMKG